MRSESEVRRAAELHARYIADGALQRLNSSDRDCIVGVVACLEWVLGEGDSNPVAGTLKDLERFFEGHKRN